MIPLHRQPQFKIPGISHAWTAVDGPDFRGPADTAEHSELASRFASAVHLSSSAWVTQVHGGDVLQVDSGGWAGNADGLWSDKPGLGVIGRSADCPIILIGGPKTPSFHGGGTHAWGFAHASWRSTLAGISSSLVKALAGAGVNQSDMQACICPSAGLCCYEVKDDVVQAAKKSHPGMAAQWFPEGDGQVFFDLWQANRDIMVDEGMAGDQIFLSGICSICNPEYHSFRRDGGASGRFAAIIGRP